MSLTGIPLIVVAILVTAVTGAATVLRWSWFGRWRLLGRTAGILLTETLVVITTGLVVNRADMFYPSWAALEGRTGTTAVTATRRAGRLDALVHGATAATVPWRPADAAAWRLAGSPRVVFPTGYRLRRSVAYPAVLSLVDNQAEAAAAVRMAHGVAAVGVVAVPTSGTTAAALTTLPADLAADVRVSTRGWAVTATAGQAALAARLFRSGQPYGALAVVGATALLAADRPGGEVSLAVVRPGRPHGVDPADRGTAVLTGSGAATWAVAESWAAAQTSPPLAAPLQLPSAGVPVLAGGGRTGRR